MSRGVQPRVAEIEAALAQARDLKAWWDDVDAGEKRIERFELYPAMPGSEPIWGFFGEAPVQNRKVPVMGVVVDDFFDQPRVPPARQRPAADWMREQVEEFALGYWLRAEAAALPEPYPELGHASAARLSSWLSLCFPADQEFSGYGNLQRLFKLRADGQVGEFSLSDRRAIIDLRELESTYDWVTLDTREFDFNITIGGAGDDSPSLVLPLNMIVHGVASAELMIRQDQPEPGTLAVFGPGLGLIRDQAPSLLAMAPDVLQPALRLQSLRVLTTGEVRSHGVMIMPRLNQIVNLSVLAPDLFLEAADLVTFGAARGFTQPLGRALSGLPLPNVGVDPLLGSFQLLNRLTGNRAADQLCLSKEQLEKDLLAKEAHGMRLATVSTRQIWLQVPDWCRPESIPGWLTGKDVA